jgi:hypothetical protein
VISLGVHLARMAPLLMVVVAGGGCGPGETPPDGGPPLALEVVDPPGAQIGLSYGSSIELRVRYHVDDATAAPVVGRTVRFEIVSTPPFDPGGSTLARDRATTDENGIAAAVLTAGQAEANFRVAATAVNAAEADFEISVSKYDFVGLDVALAWPAGGSSTKLSARLYDDRGCADLAPAPMAQMALRTLDKSNVTSATLSFMNLLSKRYALLGRAENGAGLLLAQGCVDLGAELLPPGSQSTVQLPLALVVASPAGRYSLTSQLVPDPSRYQALMDRWGVYGHCRYGAAQTLLDAMGVTAQREPVDVGGCRPASATSLDRQLQDLLAASASAPARQLDAIASDLGAIVAGATLKSSLTVTAASETTWTAEHALTDLALSTVAVQKSYDLVSLGEPIIDVANIAAGDDAGKLTLGPHGFTLDWTRLWKLAFVELSLKVHLTTLGSPEVPALVATVIDAAARNGKTGCAAVEDLVCAVVGSCTWQTSCTSARDTVAAALDAPFAPVSALDFWLSGTVQTVDTNGDLVVDLLTAGNWTASGLLPSSFSGTRQ